MWILFFHIFGVLGGTDEIKKAGWKRKSLLRFYESSVMKYDSEFNVTYSNFCSELFEIAKMIPKCHLNEFEIVIFQNLDSIHGVKHLVI